jgi:hypothetical protein
VQTEENLGRRRQGEKRSVEVAWRVSVSVRK